MRRVASRPARRRGARSRRAGRARRRSPSTTRAAISSRRRSRRPSSRAPDRAEGDEDLPRPREGRRLDRALPERGTASPTRPSTRSGATGRSASGRERPARSRAGASTTAAAASQRPGPGRRWPGRWLAAGRAPSEAGRSTASRSGSALCVIFLLGLADLRRPLSLRNLDLLVLLSFSVSLWFFNGGDIFTSVPLAYPPMVYLLARMVWAAWRGGPGSSRAVWPVWLLAAVTVFLVGFRIGLNVRDSNVIDVGYSGVIGAHRIWHGQSPYGHMPVEGDLEACGPEDAEGEIRERVQTNGRCESANARGDTYGPVAYEAYVPAYSRSAGAGSGTTFPRRTRPPSSSTCSRSSACSSSDAGSEAPGSPRNSRSPGPPTPSRSTCRARTRTTRSCPSSSCSPSGS